MADFFVDENGVAHPESNIKKDEDKKDDFSSKYGYSTLGDNPYYILKNLPLRGPIPTLDPILGLCEFEVDRFMDKKERDLAIKSKMKSIPCLDLSVPPSNLLNVKKFDKRKKIKICSDEMKSFASQLLQSAITNGIVASTFSGALQCNVDISKLAKSQDGFLRGFVSSNGKIAEQAKFREIPSVSITPMVVFQIASMITGQYYQHIITEQLNSISQKLDQVLSLLEEADRGALEAGFQNLQELASADYIDDEKMIRLNNVRDNAHNLVNKYRNIVLNIKLNDVGHSIIKNENEADDWVKALNDSRFLPYMQTVYMAEYLFYSSTIVLIRSQLAKDRRDESYIQALAQSVNNNFMEQYAQKYHDIKWTVCLNLVLLGDNASLGKENIKKLTDNVFKRFDSFDMSVRNTLSDLNPLYSIEYKDGEPIVES